MLKKKPAPPPEPDADLPRDGVVVNVDKLPIELRMRCGDDSGFNGVFVAEGDAVSVLAVCDSFCHVKVGRKLGWLRSEYVRCSQ